MSRKELLESVATPMFPEGSLAGALQAFGAAKVARELPMSLIGLPPKEMAQKAINGAAALLIILHGKDETVAAIRKFADAIEHLENV